MNKEGLFPGGDLFLSSYFRGDYCDIYDLPEKYFESDLLQTIVNFEKRKYEYNIGMTNSDEERQKVSENFEERAEYIKDRAYQVHKSKKDAKEKEEHEASEKEKFSQKDLF